MKDIELAKRLYPLLIARGVVMKMEKGYRKEPTTDVRDITYVEYYAGYLNGDGDRTREALEDLTLNGIDYNRCSEVFDGTDRAFNGSFVEAVDLRYLAGTVVSNSGESYHFAVLCGDQTLIQTLSLISSAPSFTDALAILKKRVDRIKGKDYYNISYTARLDYRESPEGYEI